MRLSTVLTVCGLVLCGCVTNNRLNGMKNSVDEDAYYQKRVEEERIHSLNTQLKFKKDSEVENYLREIAEKMIEAVGMEKKDPVWVKVVHDQSSEWRSFSIPEYRIYLSAGILRTFEYENEVATLLAIELAHLRKNHFRNRLTLGKVQYFGPEGIFAYNEQEDLEAIDEAVRILYNTRFDPRGVLSVLERFRRNIKHSPYSGDVLKKLREEAYETIGTFSPLLNPIVRSAKFFEIQKRMRKL